MRRDWLIVSSNKVEVEKLEVLRGRIILEEVSRKSGISIPVLLGGYREHRTVAVRDRLIRRLHDELGWGSTRIGRFVGDRDHSTIIGSLKRTEKRS